MWILYWGGQPSFWLTGGAQYTVGRKATDVVIQDDPSISRVHVTITVGVTAGPGTAPLEIVESSKYGTHVECHGTTHKLASAVAWAPPATGTRIAVRVGTHGAELVCVWQATRVLLQQVPDSKLPDVRTNLQICGATEVASVLEADVVAVESLDPVPGVLAAACMGRPIIDVAHFARVKARISPKVPPPAVDSSMALPGALHASWARIVGEPVAVSRFLPTPERKTVFGGTTFVCVQPALHDELHTYVALAGGRVTLEHLPAVTRGASLAEALRPFALRHRRHRVVFTSLVDLDAAALEELRNMGLCAVDYTVLVKCIVLARHIDEVAPAPGLAEPSDGAMLAAAQPPSARRRRSESPVGARSVRELEDGGADGEAAAVTAAPAAELFEDLLVAGPPKLPPYPCFADAGAARSGGGGGSKTFQKQRLAAAVPLEEVTAVLPPAAQMVTSRVAAVDADDVVPAHVNFDVPQADVIIGATRPKRARAGAAAAAATTDLDAILGDTTAAPPQTARRQPRPGGKRAAASTAAPSGAARTTAAAVAPQAGGIFDVDNLY